MNSFSAKSGYKVNRTETRVLNAGVVRVDKVFLGLRSNVSLATKIKLKIKEHLEELLGMLTSIVGAEVPYIRTNMRKILKLFSTTSSYKGSNNFK